MLEQFKVAYDIHPWLRRAIWGMLGIGALLLFWVSGGFPPRAWLFLAAVIPQISRLWALHGPAMVLPLALLVIQSLAWAIAWGFLVWSCIAIIRHWRQSRRELQEFEEDLEEAHNEMTQEHERPQGSLLHPGQPQEVLPLRSMPLSPLRPGQPQEVSLRPTPASSSSLLPGRQQPPLVLPGFKDVDPQSASQQWQRQLSLHFEFGADWDVGIKRKARPNEDSLVALQGTCIYNAHLSPFGLFVVADGMGGHANGQDASYLSIQTLLKTVIPNIVGCDHMNDDMLIEILAEGVQHANQVVYQRSREVKEEMGTTITAALVMDTTAFVVNVGDSRTYLYRGCQGLSQVTQDHSQVARLVAAGHIGRDEIYTHPERNQVYRALGVKANPEVDWFTVPLQGDDCLLLCSDGLWEMVRDPEIEKILKQYTGNPLHASKALVRAALKGGGLDNISAIVVHLAPMTM
jgi:serine/threonine protein phosphatase PrpC